MGLFRFTVAVTSLFMMVAPAVQAGERDYIIPGGGDFHSPRSAAEMKLDSIFRRTLDDGDIVFYVRGTPNRDIKEDKRYQPLFTPLLKDAVSMVEAEEVMHNCGGIHLIGELCGLDFNPIVCTQDVPDHYLYRVERDGHDKVILTVGFAMHLNEKNPGVSGTYSMVKRGKRWVLDGILCQNGYGSFNFTDFDAIKGLTSKPREQ